MSEATPGPWVIKRYPKTIQILTENGDYIAENVRHHPNQDADARLIAAAPDLLAACEAICNLGKAPIGPDSFRLHLRDAIAQAVAAVAKVRGEKP